MIILLSSLLILSWLVFLVVMHYVRHKKVPRMVQRLRNLKNPCYRCKSPRKYVCDGCYVKLRKEYEQNVGSKIKGGRDIYEDTAGDGKA